MNLASWTGLLLLPAGLVFGAPSSQERVLSPDGTRIALVQDGDLWVAPADGGEAVRVTLHPGQETNPRWSADGGELLFSTDEGPASVQLVNVDVAVTKSVDNTAPNEGDTIVFQVIAENLGPNPATAVLLSDVLPAGTTFVSASATQGTYSDATGRWALGGLTNGAAHTLSITATVDPGTAAQTIQNIASLISLGQVDTDPANNSDAAEITVQSADLGITKTVNDPGPNQGDTITYTITVGNAGPDAGTGVQVTDVLPAGVTYAGDSPSQGSYNSGTGAWTVGTVANGGSATLQLSATVNAGTAAQTIQNDASITAADQTDTNPANNSDTASILVESVDLAVTKNVDDTSPAEGDAVVYTIVVTNGGPDAAAVVQVTDVLPAELTYASDAPSQGTYSSGSGVWSVGTIANGGSATLAITATIDVGAAGAVVENTAAVPASALGASCPANDSDSATLTVQSVDISVTKSVNNPAPNEGASIVYTVTATNGGPDPATSVTVTDLLPAGVTYSSSVLSQGTYDDQTGAWDFGPLGVSTTATLTINAAVNIGTAGSTIQNVATRTASMPGDTNPGNDSDTADITVQAVDLAVGKIVDDATPEEGGTIQYTVTVTNNGPNVATGVEITDVLPAGLTFVSSTSSQGSYSAGLWTVGSLANATSATLGLTATVNNGTAGTTIQNVASVTAVDQTDTSPGNDSAAVDIHVSPEIDIDVSKAADDPTPKEGDPVIYTVTATNLGPNSATGVKVTDLVPVGTTFQTANPGQGNSYSIGSGQWSIPALTNGATATLTLTVTVNAGTTGQTIQNVATRTASDQTDTNSANDVATADITVQFVDIAVAKVVDDETPPEGSTIVYTITATNVGLLQATGVEVTDLLPAGVVHVSDLPSHGSYDDGTGIWSVGTLAGAAIATLQITAAVEVGTGDSTITNSAALTAVDQTDLDSGNDAAAVDITVERVVGALVQTPFVPTSTSLSAARPNPFRDATWIQFDVPSPAEVDLTVYDITGRLVATLVHGPLTAGRFLANWDGRDGGGARVSTGVYFVRLQAGSFSAVRKAVRLD
ncbi:MAG: FlgD immunoglobulin-like domain containing protein [Candidatus Eiseniibacteriota bacterium]